MRVAVLSTWVMIAGCDCGGGSSAPATDAGVGQFLAISGFYLHPL